MERFQAFDRRVEVNGQTVLSIEKGKYRPSIELVLRLAWVFGVPVEALFELKDEEGSETP